MNTRKVIVVVIAIGVGLLHFVTGPRYGGPFPVFVNGYLIDILLPFAMFLVFGLTDQSFLQNRIFRALVLFMVGATAEILQFFEVPVLGRTFDVLDFLMYAAGIGSGVLFEHFVLNGKSPEDDGMIQ